MIKLAILGAENSHAWGFAPVLAPKDGEKKFPDVELLGVYADLNEYESDIGLDYIKENSTCKVFADHYNDFLEEADAVMVTARKGKDHFKYAKSYIEKGIPVWIDKPTTCDTDELVEMYEYAQKHGAILSGGSSLEYAAEVQRLAEAVRKSDKPVLGGHVTAPVDMENEYGGFWFYTQHLVQMITTVFGCDVKSVRAEKTPLGVNARYRYENFDVTAFFGTSYSVTVYLEEWNVDATAFQLTADYFMPELVSFYNVIKSGKADKTRKEYMTPVFMLDATIRSYNEDREVEIAVPQD